MANVRKEQEGGDEAQEEEINEAEAAAGEAEDGTPFHQAKQNTCRYFLYRSETECMRTFGRTSHSLLAPRCPLATRRPSYILPPLRGLLVALMPWR